MKTKEELNALKEEVETLNKKLAELSEDELKAVTGGFAVKDGTYWLSQGDCFMLSDMIVVYEGLSTQCSGTDSILFYIYLSTGIGNEYKLYTSAAMPVSSLSYGNYLGSKSAVEKQYRLYK